MDSSTFQFVLGLMLTALAVWNAWLTNKKIELNEKIERIKNNDVNEIKTRIAVEEEKMKRSQEDRKSIWDELQKFDENNKKEFEKLEKKVDALSDKIDEKIESILIKLDQIK